MKGYRTVLLNIAMTLAMGGTVQLADLPPSIRAWLTLGAAVWGFGAILLRLFTSTPIGQKALARIEASLGIPADDMAAALAHLPQAADLAALSEQAKAIAADVAALKAALPTAPSPAAPAA